MEILTSIKEAFYATSLLEWAGVVTGLLYVILIAKKYKIGWVFAIICSAIYTYITFQSKIYNETFLQFFYIIMGFYGWISWNNVKTEEQKEHFVVRWTLKRHLVQITLGLMVTFVVGYFVDHYTDDASPYLDTFSTVFSLLATFMDTKRILENWLYWVVIDTALLFLYAGRELYLTGLLYFIYTLISIFAFIYWYRTYQKQQK